MSMRTASPKLKYHPNAYDFIFSALRRSQQKFQCTNLADPEDEKSHIDGPELLDGIRELALERFGLLARIVFKQWGITTTDDFGHMVYEMIEKKHMQKTEGDQLEDFFGVYDFTAVFDDTYQVDLENAFRSGQLEEEADDDSFDEGDFDQDDFDEDFSNDGII